MYSIETHPPAPSWETLDRFVLRTRHLQQSGPQSTLRGHSRGTRHAASANNTRDERRDPRRKQVTVYTFGEYHQSGRPTPKKRPRRFRAGGAEVRGGDRSEGDHRRQQGQHQPHGEVVNAAEKTPCVQNLHGDLGEIVGSGTGQDIHACIGENEKRGAKKVEEVRNRDAPVHSLLVFLRVLW